MPLKLPSFRARRDAYPADLWTKCPSCETMLFNKQLDKALRVCPTCGHHFRLSAAARLEQLLDEGTWAERDAGLQSVDALGFVDQKRYPDRLAAAQTSTGMRDAAVWGTGAIGGDRGRDLRHGLRVHGRLDGRGRRREGDARRRARPRRARIPLDRRQRVGRRADAGGHARADAAGQDARRDRAPARRPACRSSRSCPTRRPAASSPRSPRSATSTSPSRTRSSGSPARASRPGPSPRSCRPGFQRAEFLFSHGFVDRVVARAELRDELIAPPPPAARPRRRSPPTGRGRRRRARLPPALLPLDPGRPGQRAGRRRERRATDDAPRPAPPTNGAGDGHADRSMPRATAPGPGSSWRATCAARGRSSSSRR